MMNPRSNNPGSKLPAGLGGGLCPLRISSADRIVLPEPVFDVLSLGCEYHPLPGHLPGALVVLTHQIRPFIQNMYGAIRCMAMEPELGKGCWSVHSPV
jgi:hypothetical protein